MPAITFGVKVQEQRSLSDVGQRLFNRYVRFALLAAAKEWITAYLPRHFGPLASRRYRYDPRSRAWKAAKLKLGKLAFIPSFQLRYNAARQRGALEGLNVPAFDPKPFELTGDLMREVLGRSPVSYLRRTTAAATSRRQRVRVPVRLPHAINPVNAGELTLLLNEEAAALHGKAASTLKRLLEGDQGPVAELGEQVARPRRRTFTVPAV